MGLQAITDEAEARLTESKEKLVRHSGGCGPGSPLSGACLLGSTDPPVHVTCRSRTPTAAPGRPVLGPQPGRREPGPQAQAVRATLKQQPSKSPRGGTKSPDRPGMWRPSPLPPWPTVRRSFHCTHSSPRGTRTSLPAQGRPGHPTARPRLLQHSRGLAWRHPRGCGLRFPALERPPAEHVDYSRVPKRGFEVFREERPRGRTQHLSQSCSRGHCSPPTPAVSPGNAGPDPTSGASGHRAAAGGPSLSSGPLSPP